MTQTGHENVLEKDTVKEAIKPPNLFNVVMINDDFTTVDFVVRSLKSIFNRRDDEAINIARKVDRDGHAIANAKPYTRDIAEQKVSRLEINAANEGHPFKSRIEPAP